MAVRIGVWAHPCSTLKGRRDTEAEWARDGMPDTVWPMSHNPCFDRFQRFTAGQEPLLRSMPGEFWPGVGRSSSPGTIDTSMIIRQIEYARDSGAEGVMVFHAGALEEEDYAALTARRA